MPISTWARGSGIGGCPELGRKLADLSRRRSPTRAYDALAPARSSCCNHMDATQGDETSCKAALMRATRMRGSSHRPLGQDTWLKTPRDAGDLDPFARRASPCPKRPNIGHECISQKNRNRLSGPTVVIFLRKKPAIATTARDNRAGGNGGSRRVVATPHTSRQTEASLRVNPSVATLTPPARTIRKW